MILHILLNTCVYYAATWRVVCEHQGSAYFLFQKHVVTLRRGTTTSQELKLIKLRIQWTPVNWDTSGLEYCGCPNYTKLHVKS
jgi:hypothetical protein